MRRFGYLVLMFSMFACAPATRTASVSDVYTQEGIFFTDCLSLIAFDKSSTDDPDYTTYRNKHFPFMGEYRDIDAIAKGLINVILKLDMRTRGINETEAEQTLLQGVDDAKQRFLEEAETKLSGLSEDDPSLQLLRHIEEKTTQCKPVYDKIETMLAQEQRME